MLLGHQEDLTGRRTRARGDPNSAAQHSAAQHSAAQRSTAQHCAAQRSTAHPMRCKFSWRSAFGTSSRARYPRVISFALFCTASHSFALLRAPSHSLQSCPAAERVKWLALSGAVVLCFLGAVVVVMGAVGRLEDRVLVLFTSSDVFNRGRRHARRIGRATSPHVSRAARARRAL